MGCKIIAEIGINHNGSIDQAISMIQKSKQAKADIVKFQKRDIHTVYNKDFLKEKRISPWGNTQLDQKMGLEFGEEEYDKIDKYCKQINIEWFASAWDIKSLKFLDKYNLKFNKIASPMIASITFLKEVAKKKKYTFISTGMSNYEMIENAIQIFKDEKCDFELMHCISQYPFDDKYANLKMINHLSKKYGCRVGYSGHEKSGQVISVAAVTLGATSIERHVTLDRTMYGSDQAASLTFSGLANLVNSIRKVEEAMIFSKDKQILDIEIDVAKKLRSHIVNE